MSSGKRRQGRELALKVIYPLQGPGIDLEETLTEFWSNFRFRDDVLGEPLEEMDGDVPVEIRQFTEDLALGVARNLGEIDATIERFSTNWSLERMARVDLALLRMATYELLHRADIPASVVINEAIEIGKRYGTKETPAFINGILDKISRTCRSPAQ